MSSKIVETILTKRLTHALSVFNSKEEKNKALSEIPYVEFFDSVLHINCENSFSGLQDLDAIIGNRIIYMKDNNIEHINGQLPSIFVIIDNADQDTLNCIFMQSLTKLGRCCGIITWLPLISQDIPKMITSNYIPVS